MNMEYCPIDEIRKVFGGYIIEDCLIVVTPIFGTKGDVQFGHSARQDKRLVMVE